MASLEDVTFGRNWVKRYMRMTYGGKGPEWEAGSRGKVYMYTYG